MISDNRREELKTRLSADSCIIASALITFVCWRLYWSINMHGLKILRIVAAFALMVLYTVSSANAEKIVVIVTDEMTSTQRTVSGTQRVIKESLADNDLQFRKFLISVDENSISISGDSIRQYDPDIIITVGSAATRIAKNNFPELPIVFAGVLYPVISGFVDSFSEPGLNITGASLSLPVETQFRYFSTIIPNLRQIGVLYSDNTASLVKHAEPIAKEMGLELIPVRVNDHKELGRALDSLNSLAQGIWAIADPTLFSPRSTKYILLHTLRHGIPVMGFSRHLVKSGALFGLDFDYKAVGRQAGGMAVEILKGTNPNKIPITRPDIIWFHYNEKTAERMSIVIPPDLVEVAKEVYR